MSWIIPAVGVGLSIYDRVTDDGDDNSASTTTTQTRPPKSSAQTAAERNMYHKLYGDWGPWAGEKSQIDEIHNSVISKLPQFKNITPNDASWNDYLDQVAQAGGWDRNEENDANVAYWRNTALQGGESGGGGAGGSFGEDASHIAELMEATNAQRREALFKYAGETRGLPSVGIGFGGKPMFNLTTGVRGGNKEHVANQAELRAGEMYPESLGELQGAGFTYGEDKYFENQDYTRQQNYLNYLQSQQSGQGTTTQTANLPSMGENWAGWLALTETIMNNPAFKDLWSTDTKATVAKGAADSGYDSTADYSYYDGYGDVGY